MTQQTDAPNAVTLRLARRDDADAIAALIERSVHGLQDQDYTQAQMDGALGTVFGVDTRLIDDGAYFVAEQDGEILGCGGWSWRKTLFGGDHVASKDDGLLQPGVDPARIRAFFIDPAHARRGLGSLILEACENAARRQGFVELELVATLTGEKLYQKRGFSGIERFDVQLPNGEALPVVRMRRMIGA